MSIKRLCCATGCPNFREENSFYCKKHSYLQEERDRKAEERKMEFYKNRPRTTSQFYHTSRWRTERKQFLEENPHCSICGSTATEVHHCWSDKSYLTDEGMFFEQSRWMPLCHSCHTYISNGRASRKSTSLNVFTGMENQ